MFLRRSSRPDPEPELDCRQPIRAALNKVSLSICLLMSSCLNTPLVVVILRHVLSQTAQTRAAQHIVFYHLLALTNAIYTSRKALSFNFFNNKDNLSNFKIKLSFFLSFILISIGLTKESWKLFPFICF